MINTNKTKLNYTREELKGLLLENTMTILFKKVNGTNRKLVCTLQPSFLPKKLDSSMLVVNQTNDRINDNVLSVWDVENEGWRSFRIDSVIEANIENEGE